MTASDWLINLCVCYSLVFSYPVNRPTQIRLRIVAMKQSLQLPTLATAFRQWPHK